MRSLLAANVQANVVRFRVTVEISWDPPLLLDEDVSTSENDHEAINMESKFTSADDPEIHPFLHADAPPPLLVDGRYIGVAHCAPTSNVCLHAFYEMMAEPPFSITRV